MDDCLQQSGVCGFPLKSQVPHKIAEKEEWKIPQKATPLQCRFSSLAPLLGEALGDASDGEGFAVAQVGHLSKQLCSDMKYFP